MNRIIRNIPNGITCLNLVAGCLAILCSVKGSSALWGLAGWQWACIFIGVAAVADFCDGLAARLLHAYTALGKELDSLCDLVSFGVAPAFLTYYSLGAAGAPEWVCYAAVLLPVGGALRLARFNIDTRQATTFIGLPIPANAIFWIGYSALLYGGVGFMSEWWVALGAILALAWLMVSPVKMFSLKFAHYGWRGNEQRWLLVVSAPVLVACMGVGGLLWLMVEYVAMSIFKAD